MARYTGPRVRVSRIICFKVIVNLKCVKALKESTLPTGENGY